MNRQDIIDMIAKVYGVAWTSEAQLKDLERFAALVASAEREKYEAIITNMTKLLEAQQKRESVAVDMIAAGIATEREACAKVCEENATDLSEGDWDSACINCADHIRTRGDV